jgi:DNA polymerase-3 subunit gamma/tau
MLSTAAFNALLKSIEEPPPHAAFIMATTELHKVPDTIISRSQVFEFRGPRTIGVKDEGAGRAGERRTCRTY